MKRPPAVTTSDRRSLVCEASLADIFLIARQVGWSADGDAKRPKKFSCSDQGWCKWRGYVTRAQGFVDSPSSLIFLLCHCHRPAAS